MTAPRPDGPSLDEAQFEFVSAEQRCLVEASPWLEDGEKLQALSAIDMLGSGEYLGILEVTMTTTLGGLGFDLVDGLWQERP